MKKMIKNCFAILFFIQISYSQSVQLGIKAGANYANVTGSNLKTSPIVNYHAGLVAKIGISKGLSIQPELLYSTQGASYETALSDYKNSEIMIVSSRKFGKILRFSMEADDFINVKVR
jgi:hypothetical protein